MLGNDDDDPHIRDFLLGRTTVDPNVASAPAEEEASGGAFALSDVPGVEHQLIVVSRSNIGQRVVRDWLLAQRSDSFSRQRMNEHRGVLKLRFGGYTVRIAARGETAPLSVENLWDRVFECVPRAGRNDLRVHCLRLLFKVCVCRFMVGLSQLPATETGLNALLGCGSCSATTSDDDLFAHSQQTTCGISEACERLGVEFSQVRDGQVDMGQFADLLASGANSKLSASASRKLGALMRGAATHQVWCLESLGCAQEFAAKDAASRPGAGLDCLLSNEKFLYGRRACERAVERECQMVDMLEKVLEYFEVGKYDTGTLDSSTENPEARARHYNMQRLLARHRNVACKMADRISAYADDCVARSDGEYDLARIPRSRRGRSPDLADGANPFWTEVNWGDRTVFYDLKDMQPSQKLAFVLLRQLQQRHIRIRRKNRRLYEPIQITAWRAERHAECLRCGLGSPWCRCGANFRPGRSRTVCSICHRAEHVQHTHEYVPLGRVVHVAGRRRMQNTRAYRDIDTVSKNVRAMCAKDRDRALWRVLTSSAKTEIATVGQLAEHVHEELPDMEENLNAWSFRNGIFWRLHKATDRPHFFHYECGSHCRHSPEPYPASAAGGSGRPCHLFVPRLACGNSGAAGRHGHAALVLSCARVSPEDATRAALSYDLQLEDSGAAAPPQISGWCDGRPHSEGSRVRVYFRDGTVCAWYRVAYDQTWSPPRRARIELEPAAFFALAADLDRVAAPDRPFAEAYLLHGGQLGPQEFADAWHAPDQEAAARRAQWEGEAKERLPRIDPTPDGCRRFSAVAELMAAWERCMTRCSTDFHADEARWGRRKFANIRGRSGPGSLSSYDPDTDEGGYDDVDLPAHIGPGGGVDRLLDEHRRLVGGRRALGCDFALDADSYTERGRLVLDGVPDHMLLEQEVRRHTHCIGCFGQDDALPALREVVSRKFFDFFFDYERWLRSVQGPTLPAPPSTAAADDLRALASRRHWRGEFNPEAPPSRHHELFRKSRRGPTRCRCCFELYTPRKGRTVCPKTGAPCLPWIIRDGLFGRGSRQTTPLFDSIFEAQHLQDADTFDADRAAGLIPVPKRSTSTLSVIKCVFGRLLHPVLDRDIGEDADPRGNWEIAVFQKGFAQTGKSISMNGNLELFTQDQVCSLSDNCQDKFTGFDDEALVVEQQEFGRTSNRNDSEFCTTVSNQGYTFNKKHKEPITGKRFPAHQIYCGNSMPPWPDTNGRISRRLFIIPFNYQVPDTDINLELPCLMKRQEIGYILANNCFAFAWYSRAHQCRIWDFCPKVFIRAKEAAMTADSFRAFARESEELIFREDAYIPLRDVKKKYREFCLNSGRRPETWTEDLYSAEAAAKKFRKTVGVHPYPPPSATAKARAEYAEAGNKPIRGKISWFEGVGLREFFGGGDQEQKEKNPTPDTTPARIKPEQIVQALSSEVSGLDEQDARERLGRLVEQALRTRPTASNKAGQQSPNNQTQTICT